MTIHKTTCRRVGQSQGLLGDLPRGRNGPETICQTLLPARLHRRCHRPPEAIRVSCGGTPARPSGRYMRTLIKRWACGIEQSAIDLCCAGSPLERRQARAKLGVLGMICLLRDLGYNCHCDVIAMPFPVQSHKLGEATDASNGCIGSNNCVSSNASGTNSSSASADNSTSVTKTADLFLMIQVAMYGRA